MTRRINKHLDVKVKGKNLFSLLGFDANLADEIPKLRPFFFGKNGEKSIESLGVLAEADFDE